VLEVKLGQNRALDGVYISVEEQSEILILTEKLKFKIQRFISVLKNSGSKGYK